MLNYHTCKKIETNRLIIRVVIEDDCDSFFAFCKDKEVTKYLSFEPYKDVKETKKVIENMLYAYIHGNDVNYSIILKDNLSVIGSVSLSFFEDKDDVELGYIFNRQYWGNGYAKEAINAILEYTKDHIKRNKVVASCMKENIRSSNLLEALDFKFVNNEIRCFKNKGDCAILNYEKTLY